MFYILLKRKGYVKHAQQDSEAIASTKDDVIAVFQSIIDDPEIK